jgi:hypothetical protein
VRYGVVARPGSLPGARYLAGVSFGIFLVWVSLAGFVLLLTPTGSLPSPRWRWWAGVAAAGPVLEILSAAIDPQPLYPEHPEVGNPLAVPALHPVGVAVGIAGGAIVLVSLVVAAVSLVLRYRRAHGTDRLQLRWLAFAAGMAAGLMVVAVAAGFAGLPGLVLAALGVMVALLPLATGAAILRYRLYDLDRIISRTVAYGLLTLVLGGGYAVVVLGLGQLLGRDSSLVVAAATLCVAALFQPLRRRIQAAVDRRFNRRRYDATRVIDEFGARLREQVDLDALSAELLVVADRTMQPTQASIWLPRTTASVCSAISSSSLVGTTSTATLLSSDEIVRALPERALLRLVCSLTPSPSRPWQTPARTASLFSPIPAVKTSASRRPRAAV